MPGIKPLLSFRGILLSTASTKAGAPISEMRLGLDRPNGSVKLPGERLFKKWAGSSGNHAFVEVNAHPGEGNVPLFGNNPVYRGEIRGPCRCIQTQSGRLECLADFRAWDRNL